MNTEFGAALGSCEWAPQSGNVRAGFEMRHVTTRALESSAVFLTFVLFPHLVCCIESTLSVPAYSLVSTPTGHSFALQVRLLAYVHLRSFTRVRYLPPSSFALYARLLAGVYAHPPVPYGASRTCPH